MFRILLATGLKRLLLDSRSARGPNRSRSWSRAGRPRSFRPVLEDLEVRRLLSISLVGSAPAWVEQGPNPITGYGGVSSTPNTSVGAIESAVVEPTFNGYIVYVGTVNGGIWRSNNIASGMFQTANSPGYVDPQTATWRPLTDNQPSLATSSMALDPRDQSGNTLWVGTGSVSSAGDGGPGIGLLRTTDGGNTWTNLGSQVLSGQQIVRVLPTKQTDTLSGTGHGGQIVLAASYQNGIYYSGDGGQTFGNGPVLSGGATDIVEDPNLPNTFYAALAGEGVWESDDYGRDQWRQLASPKDINMKLAVTTDGNDHTILWVATTQTVYRADMTGTPTFTPVGQSSYDPVDKFDGIQALSITADFGSSNVAYVAKYGELLLRFTYQPGTTNNGTADLLDSLYLEDLSGQAQAAKNTTLANLYNNDYNSLNQFTRTFPHGDIRGLTFLNSNTLLETDDGGIYGLLGVTNTQTYQFPAQPNEQSVVQLSAPGWVSLNGSDVNGNPGIRDTEFFSVGYDTVNGILVGGNQDNGTALQSLKGSLNWNSILGGDGATSAVDPTTTFVSVFPPESFPDPTVYMIGNGVFYKAFEGFPAASVLLEAPNNFVQYSGLNAFDAQTESQVNGDISRAFALNTFTGQSPEPLLFGMTGLYESFDGGNTVLNVSPPGMQGFVQSIAYGSLNSPLAAYFLDNGQLWVRNNLGATGKTFASVPLPPGSGFLSKVVMDPNDYHIAYLLDSKNNVWQLQMIDNGQNTTNGGTVGAVWQNITDNLDTVANIQGKVDLRSLEIYHPLGGNPVVLVGGLGGVYRRLPTGLGGFFWSRYGAQANGASFPTVLVPDLHYVPVPSNPNFGSNGDVLLAGTFGRGAWIVPQASATLEQPATLTINADPGGPNVIRLVLDPGIANPTVDVFQNNNSSTPNFQIPLALVNLIQVNSLGIPTTLIVDESNGAINSEMEFLGGSGNDTLVVNDKKDASAENITLGTDQITGLGPGILYSKVNHVQWIGGTAAVGLNTFTLANTDATVQTTEVDTGPAANINEVGSNLVNVQQTAGAATIKSGGPDIINVGDANGVQDIRGALTVNGDLDRTDLYLNDKGDGGNRNFTVTDTTITNLAPATITYSGVGTLSISSGDGGTQAQVLNTAAPIILKPPHGPPILLGTTTTYINKGGTGNLVVTVAGTQSLSPLNISGAFLVQVGNGTVQGIQGDVQVEDGSVLEVDDITDTHAEQPHLGKASDFATSGNYALTGLAPATVAFGNKVGLTVENFGPGGTFTVNDTLANTNTNIEGKGTVDVLGTTGNLSVTGPTLVDVGLGNVQNINGQVFVSEPFGDILDHATLIVDDSADTKSKTVTTGLAFGSVYSIAGLAPAAIEYQGPQVSSVTIDAPSTPENSIDVNGTPTGTALTVHAGFGNITVIEVPDIGGPLTVALGEDNTTYWFDGPATDNNRVYTLNSASVTRTGGFVTNIVYPNGFASESFALYTGNPNTDTIDVQSSLPHTGWFLDGGAFNPNVFNIGDPVKGLAAVQGEIHVNPESESLTSDAETVNLNDQPDTPSTNPTNSQTFTFSFDPNQNLNNVSWDGGGFLAYNNTPPPLGNLVINAGSVNTTFQVKTLPALNTAISLKGGSGSNTLNYSQYVGNVTVDLSEGTATGFTGGISNIHTVIGSQGNDTFYVPSDAVGTTTSITGGTGQNNYFVGADGTAAGLVRNIDGAVVLTGAGSGNTLTVDDSGNTTTTDTVSLTPTSVSGSSFFGSGGSLSYTGIGSAILQASNASRIVRTLFGTQIFGDAITVEPQSNMVFTIDGNNPPAGSHPGDSLTVNTALVGTVTAHPSPTIAGSGYFTTSNGATVVNYSGIETLAPVGWLVAAPDAGQSPEVKVYNAQSGALRFDITAFDPSFLGGVRVAVGDINGDGIPDIVAAQGPGDGSSGDSLVHIYSGITGQLLAGPLGSIDPFPGFHGGLYVAAADLDSSGYADLIVSQDAGGQGLVNIYSGQTGVLLTQFQPFDTSFTGAIRLAAGPVTSNGHVDVVTGAGPGGPPLVEVFDGLSLLQGVTTPVASFNAFDPSFTGGVYVATGLIHDQGQPPAAVIVGEGAGGEPQVSIFDGTGKQVQTFLAFDRGFKGGVRVAAADVTGSGRSDIVVAEGPGHGSKPEVRAFDGVTLQRIDQFLAFPADDRDGLFVAGGGKWGLFNPANTTGAHPSLESPATAVTVVAPQAGATGSGNSGAELRIFNRVADSIVLPLDLAAVLANSSLSLPPQGVDAVVADGVEPWSVRAVDYLFAAMGRKLKDENRTFLAS